MKIHLQEIPGPAAGRGRRSRAAFAAGSALALLLGAPSHAAPRAQDERELERARELRAEVQEKLRRGRLRTVDVVLALEANARAGLCAARAVRALHATGDAAAISNCEPVLRALADAPPSPEPEEVAERIEAFAAAGPTWKKSLERELARLFELQGTAGGFAPLAEVREGPDGAAVTARAVLACRAATLAGALPPAERLHAAGEFLISRQQRDGGLGGPGRRSKSNGAATAGAIAAWTWLASSDADRERCARYEAALTRAEAWLLEEWTVERNPGSNGEGISWLVDLERAEELALLAPETAKRRTKRRDGHLADYQLPDWGWNHRASLQDVMGPAGSLPSGAGAGAGTGPGRLPRGLGAVPQVVWDPFDTASATLALAEPTRPTEAELKFTLQRRFASARNLPPAERFEEFVELLRPHFAIAVPELIAVLSAPEAARRSFALKCLRALTGESLGFEAAKSAADEGNARALEAWRTWWMTEGRKRAEK